MIKVSLPFKLFADMRLLRKRSNNRSKNTLSFQGEPIIANKFQDKLINIFDLKFYVTQCLGKRELAKIK